MQENYKILNVSPEATDQEITEAYERLKAQYSKDRFLEGEAGNLAAKNLTKLEAAYRDIMESRSESASDDGKESMALSEVEGLIKLGKIAEAQQRLDAFNDRSAEWHYLQSVVFYKKSWMNESLKQLEIALSMDVNNAKYKDAYTKMQEKIKASEAQFRSGNASFNNESQQNINYEANQANNRQMGGSDCDCCSTCAAWCCADMLCSMCCH